MATTDSLVEGDRRERDESTTGSPSDSSGDDHGGDTARVALRGRGGDASRDDYDDGWHWKAAAGLGALALLGALAVVVLPGTLLRPVGFAAATVRALRSLALVLGAVVGVFGLYVVSRRDPADDEADGAETVDLATLRPERPHGPSNDAVGTRLDAYLDRIGGQVDRRHDDSYNAYRVEKNLESLAVAVVADAAECSRERAREHVAAGTWTDDVRAAAFLGGSGAPDRSLAMRVRDWANGATYDRQVRATLDELAAVTEGDRR